MTWSDSLQSLNVSCQGAFSTLVTYTPVDGEPVELDAIFDQHRETDTVSGDIDRFYPTTTLDILLSALGSTPEEGDQVVVNGVTWKVIDVDISSHTAMLLLKR